MALTTTTSLANTIKTYYDRMLLEVLDPQLKFYQFGVKKPLPKNEGTSVLWNRPKRLATGYVLAEGANMQLSAANALSTDKVSAVIRQFGGFTTISDLVDMTSITDVMKMAAERLGQQAGETIERVIICENFIQNVPALNTSAHHLIKTSTEITDYWGSVSGVSVIAKPGGPVGTVSSANVIAVSDIRSSVYNLKRLNVAPYEGNDYVAIINTETAEDIVGDSTWINFHQYAAPGQNNLYTGEIGKIYGCRFVETNNGPAARGSNAGGTASSLAYGTVVMGKGFYGVTELDGGVRTYISQGASKADPLNQLTVYGWKANFISKTLNASAGLVFWAGSGDTTTAGAESANGGAVRIDYPTAY